eukprot:TRINITY_DN2130_c0_g2_i1.p1 TRINITY_DN2130_c0_g2~~TRINITY_DN2130_c0_g2_i1.p1  ORF type:complete len:117 (+),score=14.30 TRINITY_DN2130_c0_g2_i1:42-392(+)
MFSVSALHLSLKKLVVFDIFLCFTQTAIPYLGFILSSHCKFRTPSPSSKTHIMLSEQPDHHTPEMQINSKTSSNHSTNTTHVDPMQYSTSIAISLLNYLQGYINSLNSSLLIRELY